MDRKMPALSNDSDRVVSEKTSDHYSVHIVRWTMLVFAFLISDAQQRQTDFRVFEHILVSVRLVEAENLD